VCDLETEEAKTGKRVVIASKRRRRIYYRLHFFTPAAFCVLNISQLKNLKNPTFQTDCYLQLLYKFGWTSLLERRQFERRVFLTSQSLLTP
jgi:hypothetical protein